jgi:hypothetical protein
LTIAANIDIVLDVSKVCSLPLRAMPPDKAPGRGSKILASAVTAVRTLAQRPGTCFWPGRLRHMAAKIADSAVGGSLRDRNWPQADLDQRRSHVRIRP